MTQNVWFIAAIWMALALSASLISIWAGISVALVEILVGVVAGNFLGIHATTDWINFLALLGSGVLTFLAGTDIDPVSVSVTLENASRNDVVLEPFVADALVDPLPDAPLWVANILRRPLEELLGRPDAAPRAIVSGLLSDEPLDAPAYRVERRAVLDGWQAILLARR